LNPECEEGSLHPVAKKVMISILTFSQVARILSFNATPAQPNSALCKGRKKWPGNHAHSKRKGGQLAMEEIRSGDWVQILPDNGIKPAWAGKKAFVQQSLVRDGVPVLFAYIFGEGSAMLYQDQVRPIPAGILGAVNGCER
jgi:hypothetical protein